MKVLFICKGNYFRSQIAEAIYNKITNSHDASSAGTYTGAIDEPEGQKLADLFEQEYFSAMRAHGLELESKITKKLTPEMLAKADAVVSMAEEPYIPDFLRNDKRVIWWDVPNPDVVDREMREVIYEQIKRLIMGLFGVSYPQIGKV